MNILYQFLKRPLQFRIILPSTILMLIAFLFNGYLVTANLEQVHINTMVSGYRVVGDKLKQHLDDAFKYGKRLDKFVGINLLLDQTVQDMNAVGAMSSETSPAELKGALASIVSSDNKVIYSTFEPLIGTDIHANVLNPENRNAWFAWKNKLLIPITLNLPGGEPPAYILIGFDRSATEEVVSRVRHIHLKAGIWIAGITFICLVLFAAICSPPPLSGARNEHQPTLIYRKQFFALVLVAIISSQLVFSVIGIRAFNIAHDAVTKQKARIISGLIQQNINYLTAKGLKLNMLYGIEGMLNKLTISSPEIQTVEIQSEDGKAMYQVSSADAPQSDWDMKTGLKDKYGNSGYLCLKLNKSLLKSKMLNIIYDALTVLLISILFAAELLYILSRVIDTTQKGGAARSRYLDIRPVAFLFSFGMDICVSFLPLQMEKLYMPVAWLSRDMVIGLPISVEMFFEGIAIIAAGAWVDRKGWPTPLTMGLFLTAAGTFYSWLSPDGWHLIASRAVTGLGYGWVVIAAQSFCVVNSSANEKSKALTQMFAGLFAGSICGGAAGAMIAERFGFDAAFFAGGCVVCAGLIYLLIYRKTVPAVSFVAAEKQPEKIKLSVSLSRIYLFMKNKNIFAVVFLVGLPAAIAFIGFIYYYCPVYLQRMGVSQSNIGRIFMIHGICMIYLAPLISRWVDASKAKKPYLAICGLIAGAGFSLYAWGDGAWLTAAAVFLLGISTCFFYAALNPYILKLPVSHNIGEGMAMGLISASGRIGQVAGPMIFALILGLQGVNGPVLFGVIYLVATILFMLLARDDRELDFKT